MASVHSRIAYEDFTARAAAVTTALREISKAPAEAGLDKGLLELIKIRASQLNGCAFCLQLHLNFARKAGVPAAKLDLVAAWREAGDRFGARERAALAWTEALTRLESGCASDADYQALRVEFSDDEVLYLTVAIGHINFWNRLGVGLQFAPPAVA